MCTRDCDEPETSLALQLAQERFDEAQALLGKRRRYVQMLKAQKENLEKKLPDKHEKIFKAEESFEEATRDAREATKCFNRCHEETAERIVATAATDGAGIVLPEGPSAGRASGGCRGIDVDKVCTPFANFIEQQMLVSGMANPTLSHDEALWQEGLGRSAPQLSKSETSTCSDKERQQRQPKKMQMLSTMI